MSITLYWIRETELPNINKSCFSEISIKDIIESFFKHGNEYLEKSAILIEVSRLAW